VTGDLEVSVVVASHERQVRLRLLLDALMEQTLARERWEVVVVHDYDGPTAQRVIEDHPLAGAVRHIAIEPGSGSPSRQRNIGWRAARAPLVAFTDDDCRPDSRWLEELVSSADANGGAVVQGRTRPDPREAEVLHRPLARSLHVEPVNPYAETANILYPRALLERLGGFDERAVAGGGEDVGLGLRARADGAEFVAAPNALVYHAVEAQTLPAAVRRALLTRHLAYLVKQHPEFRRELVGGVFWNREHLELALALAGLLCSRRAFAALALVAPYAARLGARRGPSPRARMKALAESPGELARGLAELAGMAAGSIRHRTVLL
jgi:GT2 family glycosyltransferase